MSTVRKPHGAAAADDAFEGFEDDELPGEVTRLEPSALLAELPTSLLDEEPPKPFLLCESGKDTGKEYIVAVGENGIGRSIDNEVILTDISVSRKHLKILRDSAGELRLRDLGSGNGTLLNGTRVHDAPLKDGDRIELGETVLVVRIPDYAPARRGAAQGPGVMLAPQLGQAPGDGSITDENASPPGSAQPSFSPPPYEQGQPLGQVGYGQAGFGQAGFGQPAGASGFGQPAGQSGFGQPGFGQPGFGQPGFGQPGFGQPGSLGSHGPTPTAVATPTPRRSRGVMVVVGILGALVLVGAGAALAVALVRRDAPVVPAMDPALYARGAEAYTGRRWDDAEIAFRTILAAQPSDTRAATYLQRIQEARAHDTQLMAARAAIAASDPRRALAQLASVPANSPLAGDVANLRAQAGTLAAQQLVVSARTAYAAGRRDEAARSLAEAAGYSPNNADVAAAAQELHLANIVAVAPQPVAVAPVVGAPIAVAPVAVAPIAVAPVAVAPAVAVVSPRPVAAPVVANPRPTEQPRAAPRGNDGPARSAPPPRLTHIPTPTPTPTSMPTPTRGASGSERVLAMYRSGDFAGASRTARESARAASAAEGRRLTAMADQIDRFARDYARVRAAGNNLGGVLRQVQSVISLDEQISSGQAYARALKPRLVDALLSSANDAWSRGRVPDACLKVRQAIDLDSRNTRARDLVHRCEAKAAEMLAQAQSVERTNRPQAQALYRDVLPLVPQSSSTYQRAYTRMQALNHAPGAATGGTGPRRVPIIVDEDE